MSLPLDEADNKRDKPPAEQQSGAPLGPHATRDGKTPVVVDKDDEKGEVPPRFILKVLYLFAGAERKTSVVSYLKSMAAKKGWAVDALEVDLKRGDHFDLSHDGLQDSLVSRITAGEFHVVICTPPCSTWSRVRCANMRGPPTLRTKDHLWGFPWVSKRFEKDLELGNELVRFSIRVWDAVSRHPFAHDGSAVFVFGEHPEDLGVVIREEDHARITPASIWQIQQLRDLVDNVENSLGTVAINQCCWGAPWRKPTRLLCNSKHVLVWGSNLWPSFDGQGFYAGPLNKSCNCYVSQSLVKESNDAPFRTTGTDVYPPQLDHAIAAAIIAEFSGPFPSGPVGGGVDPKEKGQPSTLQSSGRDPGENKDDKKRKLEDSPLDDSVKTKSSGRASVEEDSYPIENPARAGRGVPIRCWYKGKERSIHDGGGLCSPGRWPVKQRKQLSSEPALGLMACCKGEFLKWVLSICSKEGDAVKEVFWSLAGGKSLSSPFSKIMDDARESLDRKLESLDKFPRRRPGDRDSEVNFRRLAAALEVVEDEDFDWLGTAAGSGVRLGVDQTMPRVPAVFEEKVKWNLDFTDEEFRDTLACNYKSAEENAEDIERQVLEEVEAGSIITMKTEEAEKRYKGRLAVAALGAVPKELGSSVVRIVHDGSYSVDINHRIKVRDRMRFPMVDDAGGILLQVEKEVEEARGAMRCSLIYDISRAHKLLPVDERDWGLQGFRLPAGKREGTVFLHTRGTFGVASAAYHWQRLAACVVRLAHRLGGVELGLLHLLFADDGWLTALGPYFWRRMLFWLFCLELFEVPIAWKKVRGGLVVHWIGYQIDVQNFSKGISEKKVKWIVEWLERHRASGGVTGRDLKSALGRFSFVAGALQHVRPFLGPIFAWAAVLSPGTFAKFPDAVAVLLDFIQGEVVKEAMTKPRRLENHPVEKFRVDAKAEADLIVIGGWEVPASGRTEDARWFSIVLNRRNAPWAYLKGEPFRNIASLELVAVLTAVMLFGKDWECDMSRTVMSLSASADNLGNTYVLNHFMSCKYPLSIVVMELAVQLKKLGLEMDLKWIPRGQNSEADSLTNSEFMGFDTSKRITVEFEDMKFDVMDKLMAKAADLDEEIKLAKSSKEAKSDRPAESMHKRKRGQTRWEDPW